MSVIGDITVSLDGFVTGPNAGPDNGLGDGGESLHEWVGSDDPVDRAAIESGATAGAVVMGRALFDVIDGPHGWSDGMGYGADSDARPPFVVVTSTRPAQVRLAESHEFHVVLDGPVAAIDTARELAGDLDVVVMGGGRLVGSCLEAGLLDRLVLHVSPLVLGGGTPLFAGVSRRPLVQREVRVSPVAVHVTYDVS